MVISTEKGMTNATGETMIKTLDSFVDYFASRVGHRAYLHIYEQYNRKLIKY